ncbi:unnamed protein product [Darwinula stevensoni]|uniref:Epoxide hydrolase n=1 Tax=Darwinula stevensoni TaxID=69355 RepID=A0A7R9A5N4_9CRUS|nr:unnamed protein product [Darwinula stevensoni]CAG0894760.1 unnamed protein product [Darwinula stevensoni]
MKGLLVMPPALAFMVKASIVLAVLLGVYIKFVVKDPEPPVLEDVYWGPGEPPAKPDLSVRPFVVSFPEKGLEELRRRLELDSRLVQALEGQGFRYGFNAAFLEEVQQYWLDEYDWRKEEARLNALPHFKTYIQGLNVHFVHVKPGAGKGKGKTCPVLLLHGWPGSFFEFYKAGSRDVKEPCSLELVIPSLPGYGFSDTAAKSGLGAIETARIMMTLMHERLGFSTFYVQGGDWGSLIATAMGAIYPDKVKGIHLNMLVVNTPGVTLKWLLGHFVHPSLVCDIPDRWKLYPMKEKLSYMLQETGYLHIQATKPDTVGVGLSQSPLGLAAYILEKFSTWTNKSSMGEWDGGLKSTFALDDLLTNVMVYWISNSITTSMRIYSESFSPAAQGFDSVPVRVPTGMAAFPDEIFVHPKSFMEHRYYDIVTYDDMPRGGHFAAFQEPQILAQHFLKFLSLVEKRE